MNVITFVCAALVVVAEAQITSMGGCPVVPAMTNFDIKKFAGRWYEQYKYFSGQEATGVCVTSDFVVNGTAVTITSKMIDLTTRTEKVQVGNAAVTGTEGKIPAMFPNNNAMVFIIINTDYTNYAAMYSCQDYFFYHVKNVFIMTRNKHPVPAVLDASFGPFNNSGIDLSALRKSEQFFCPMPY